MKPTHPRSAAAAAGLFVLVLLVRLVPGPHIVDDAYITFQYARNLAAGNGLVFNLAEHVLGTTAPLYAVLLAPAAWLFGADSLPSAAVLVSALCDGASALLLIVLGRRLLGRFEYGMGLALLHAFSTESVLFAVGGMEMSLFVLLMWTAVLLADAGRGGLAGLVCAIALPVRPEAALVGAWLFAFLLLRAAAFPREHPGSASPRARALRSCLHFAAAALAAGIPWLLFAQLAYGSPIPHSVEAKQVAYATVRDRDPHLAGVPLLRFLASGVFGESLPLALAVPLGPGSAWALVTVSLIAAGLLLRARQAPILLAIAGIAGTWLGLLAWGNPLLSGWYFVPLLSLLQVLVVTGGLSVLARVLGERPAWQRGLSWSFLLLLVAAQLDRGASLFRETPSDVRRYWNGSVREEVYADVARWLNDRVTPGERVMAAEIGALAFHGDFRVLDAAGLVSPEMVRLNPPVAHEMIGTFAITRRMIDGARPEWIVTLETFIRRSLLRDGRFHREYEEVARFPAPIWGSRHVLVYRQRT